MSQSRILSAPRLPLLVGLLPALALLLPLLILGAAAWLNWRAAWRDATAELVRSVDAEAEYGARVLSSYVIMTGRMNDLLRGLTDEQIRADEARLHQAMAGMLGELPQADAAYAVDREGYPLVSGHIFPVPRDIPTAADRDFFRALSDPAQPPIHTSRLYIGRFDNLPFFAISRRREGSGNPHSASGFDGLVNVSVRPTVLAASMRNMLGGDTDTAALIRTDGQLLVRTEALDGSVPSLQPDEHFRAIAEAGDRSAVYRARSAPDGPHLLIALRRLDGFPVYAVASRPRAAIVGAWQESVASHLILSLPVTLALFLLSLKVRRDHHRLIRVNASLEQRVAERTADLRELSEALDLSATLIMRRDGTILHWSHGCERMYGHTAAEAERRGPQFLTVYRPGEREAILAVVDRDGEWRGELRQRHKDGTPMVVISHWRLHHGSDGEKLVLMQTDITALHRLQGALAESEERFRATFEQAGIGLAHIALDGRWLRVNDRLCAMFGTTRERLLSIRFQDVARPGELAADLPQLRRLLKGEIDAYTVQKSYPRKEGGLLWAMVTISLMHDDNGKPQQFIVAVNDITHRKRAEEALAESEDRLRLAQEAAGIGTWEVLWPSRELRWSTHNAVLFGFDPAEPQPGMDAALARIHPADRDRVADELGAAMISGEFRSEFRVLRPQPEGGSSLAWIAALARRFPARLPEQARLVGVNFDITERKLAEEHNALLTREVDHRAKNALAVVQAALRLTKAESQAEFVRAVEGRIASLARAQTVLAQRRWQGAELHALLEGELMSFLAPGLTPGDGPQVRLSGPPVMLEAATTQGLCLVLHELATNAVKYGALSRPGGRVEVRWHLQEDRLRLSWQESGGPPAKPPARRGFGSRVIEQTVQRQLGGRLERHWTAAGLACEIDIPHGPAALQPQARVAAA